MAEMVERHCRQATFIADSLRHTGFEILNRVVLNQVLLRGETDSQTTAIREALQASGKAWFGGTIWQERPALRISVSSWRTQDDNVQALITLLTDIKAQAKH
ncbi:hypothetical protein [Pectobacterium brasiliense]|uniref:hypothetical protein n=1 Tax=Pectobacterium brasiliense TaxID=180957 RepID=UPI001F077CCD|nr:hypothetical protein [Pectobacterium brasiliense]